MRSLLAQRAFALARAAEMRVFMTPAERALWGYLEPRGFAAQAVVVVAGWFSILDFYHPPARLCVEVDGGVHARQRGADGRRDRRLATLGIRTLRLTNREVLEQRDAALAQVDELLAGGAA